MNIDEIHDKFYKLNEEVFFINEKIRNNCGCNFNVRELVKCWCDFGELMFFLCEYYCKFGFPSLNKQEIRIRNILMSDDFVKKCYLEICEMEKLGNFNDDVFSSENAISSLLFEITFRCCSGDYDVPKNPTVALLKKELLCDLVNVLYNLKKKSDVYYFSNAEMEYFSFLKELYYRYRDYVGLQCKNYKVDDLGNWYIFYEGPQFGKEIVESFEFLNSKYINNDDNDKKLVKV